MSKIIQIEGIMKHFYNEPNRWYHVREIARLEKLNPTTASKYLDTSYKEQILNRKEERGHILFRANTESYAYKDSKIFYNIRMIRQSGLIEFLDKELHYPEVIVLFGSYAKGENNKNSDIDLFVISNKSKNPNLGEFEKKLNSKIQLFIKTRSEFYRIQKENKNLVNSFLNGIILKGFLEVL